MDTLCRGGDGEEARESRVSSRGAVFSSSAKLVVKGAGLGFWMAGGSTIGGSSAQMQSMVEILRFDSSVRNLSVCQ